MPEMTPSRQPRIRKPQPDPALLGAPVSGVNFVERGSRSRRHFDSDIDRPSVSRYAASEGARTKTPDWVYGFTGIRTLPRFPQPSRFAG
jgi:hypothetical protein